MIRKLSPKTRAIAKKRISDDRAIQTGPRITNSGFVETFSLEPKLWTSCKTKMKCMSVCRGGG